MLPVTHSETPEEASKRQSNFITLRNLEAMISPELFQQVLLDAQRRVDMPKRIDWKGESKPLSFQEVKLNFSHVDQNYLPQLLQSAGDGVGTTNPKIIPSSSLKTQSLSKYNSFLLHKLNLFHSLKLDVGLNKNIIVQRKNLHFANFAVDQKRNLKNFEISRFERMKTIFGHSMILEGFNAPIYNVLFDQSGSFVISGADDGIIKIWDKETMNLQASLHSHNDVITDMDISRCNSYLATSSKDGRVIIWDWKNCQKIEELAAHTTTINNIKFFQVKLKSQNTQQKEVDLVEILVTCSDDGTIKVYDESMFSNHASQQSGESQQRRSKRHEAQIPKKERFFLTITPEDFRPAPGSRNKKIESVNINQNGLMVAGTNLGDIFVWKLDMAKFKQQQAKAFTWIGSFKKHQKNVHFCTFSPNGKMLFTGSTDGTAKVWNMEFEKGKKGLDAFPGFTDDKLLATLEEKRIFSKSDKQIYFRNVSLLTFNLYQRAGEEVNLAEYRQQKNKWQCDTLTWSCHGRYAIASISGKVDLDDKNQEWSILKIWDSFTNQIIQDIGNENNIQLMSYSFVIAPHPKIEEIFLSGSEGGTLCLWNIKQRRLIKKFLEYGVYSYEKYTMNNPFDGKFSPDGSSFIIGSEMGTISLFSHDQVGYQYEATRVEQFYPQDDQKHMLNIYYDRDEEPQICGFSLIPYEVQPPAPLIGKFKNSRKLTHEDYERNFVIRNELCLEEEKFIQNQLEEGQRNDFFNNQEPMFNRLDQDEEEEKELPRLGNRRPRLNSQISQIQQNHSNNAASQEDIEMLDNINQAQRRQRRSQGRRMNIRNRINDQQMQVVRLNSNIDPDNSLYDRESDENFEVSDEDEKSEDNDVGMISEELSQDESESEDFVIRTRNGRRQRQQENQSANRNQPPQRSSRAERAAKRQAIYDEEEKEVTGKRSKRKAVIHSDDGSMNDFSDDEDFSMDVDDLPKKRLQRNNRNVIDECEDDEESDFGMKTSRTKPHKDQNKDRKTSRSQRRNLRNRDNRKTYTGMDSSPDEYMESEEEKKENKPGSQSKANQRVINEDSDDQEIKALQHAISQDIKKQKGDEDFVLQPEQPNVVLDVAMIENQQLCGFCHRPDTPILGPFVRVANFQKGNQNERYYFHTECIEANIYSFYNQSNQKWMNIGKALEMFNKKSHMCTRCWQKGATAKCGKCGKFYHGFLCSQLYMLRMTDTYMQCFECRNKENYKHISGKELQKVEKKQMLRQIPRGHLITPKQKILPYIPQVNDKVYYFFQGHEKFISYYNIFFYAGDQESIPFTYPWRIYDELMKPTLCKIKSITHSFPSNKVLYLMKMYGKEQLIPQDPYIISRLEMCIADDPDKTFEVDFFPHGLPDFLVLQKIYEISKIEFQTLMNENKIVGQTFKERLRPQNQVRVVGILDKEPSLYPNSDWEMIQYKRIENHNLRERRRGRGQDQDDQGEYEVMNFWELNLKNAQQEEDEAMNQATIFTDDQTSNIIVMINDYCENKKEQTKIFKERVTDQVARDYKDFIAAEMFINLIIQRLINKFYRTYEQFFMDADLIHINARTYNGDDHDITKLAKKLADFIKNETKKMINYVEDSKRRKYEETKQQVVTQKPAGKLTAPVYKNNNYTSMDYFKQNVKIDKHYQEEVKANGVIPQRSTRRQNYQEISGMNNPDFTVKIQTGGGDSDPRVTPKASSITPISGSLDQLGQRRSTRNQNNVIQIRNDNYFNNSAGQFSTEEKTASKAGFMKYDEEGDLGTLGKRTRSGRMTKMTRPTLNEDEFDKEFERELANEEPTNMIQPFSTKRVRQH